MAPEAKMTDRPPPSRRARGHQLLGQLAARDVAGGRKLSGNLPAWSEDGTPLNRAARRLAKKGKRP